MWVATRFARWPRRTSTSGRAVAVYVQYERGEVVTRIGTWTRAEAMADRIAAEGRNVHVSLDTCG